MITSPMMTTDKKAEEIPISEVVEYIRQHKTGELPRLEKLWKYYNGDHIILSRVKKGGRSNNKLVINHAAYIANMTSAYLLGNPVAYTCDNADISPLTEALRLADSATQDIDLELDCAIFGRAYELIYMSEQSSPKLARLSPLNAFVVYDDTVEQNPVFAVYYYPVFDRDGRISRYNCSFQTAGFTRSFKLSEGLSLISVEESVPHYFGTLPINEIYNNAQRKGDYEQVVSLIDAYNYLQSDRVNDKEQFVDAFLLVKGATLGDDNDEKTQTLNAIKENRVMELPIEGASAEYLTRQFDEASVEVLKKSIVSDIHKISGVPDMSDESFAGNASGVAMKYKLLNLEEITKNKQRFFTEGLRIRLAAFANVLAVKGQQTFDVTQIDIKFKHSLPTNELELAQVAATVNGIVPQTTLLSLLPFVDDPEKAAEQLKAEKAEAVKLRQEAFANTPITADEE